ncbi:MAG TPA: carcinine hydrolase/isopenicillin-N N-acyltransferase family protein [Acidimicrobiia bacterium]
MCDTLCVVDGERLLFAKNSDRPAGEVQLVERWPMRPASRATLHTQYLDLGADPGGYASIASRPAWLWGFEHGVNEHGVAAGNEKIWTTDDPHARPKGLLGMDLVRLALERAGTADEALETITTLLEAHGQGGSGEKDADEPYDNAFLVADPARAWIVETSNTRWAARRSATG